MPYPIHVHEVNTKTSTAITYNRTQDIKMTDPEVPGFEMTILRCGRHFFSVPTNNAPVNQSSPADSCPTSGIADPVDQNTGAFKFTSTDLAVKSTFPVVVQRLYNSQNTAFGPFGTGMTIGYNQFLSTSGNSLEYTPAEGGRYLFSKGADGVYTNSAYPFLSGAKGYLNPDGTRTLRFKDGLTYAFNASGMLIEQKDSTGNRLVITRDPSGIITKVTDSYNRSVSFTYTSINIGSEMRVRSLSLIAAITDFANRKVSYSYDASGRLVTVTGPEGGVTAYTYDSSGRLAAITDPAGATEVMNQYDANGRVIQQTHADGGVYTLGYTVAGGMVTETRLTDPNGNGTAYRFNGARYSNEMTDSLGQKSTYDRAVGTNRVLSTTDALGRTRSYSYDANGNVVSTADAAGNVTSYEYESNFNKPVRIVDALGNVTAMAYDEKGNLIEVRTPKVEVTTISRNDAGQPTTIRDPRGSTFRYDYDQYGNLVAATDPLGNAAHMEYDLLGRMVTATNPEGTSTLYSYDALDRIREITDPLNGRTLFSYDANGNLLSVTDARGRTVSYTYNARNKVTGMTDQTGKTGTYSYDKNGNLTSTTDRNGKTTTYAYDAKDRIVKVIHADASTVDYAYDAVDRLTYINDSVSGAIERIYGGNGCAACGGGLDKLIKEITPYGNITYRYDATGRRTAMTVAGQPEVHYTHDASGRLTGVNTLINNAVANFGLMYDATGRRTGITYPNGVTTTYGYDNAGRLTNLESFNPLGNVHEPIGYGYDRNGNRTGMTMLSWTLPHQKSFVNAAYNEANQILSFDSKSITHDNNGSITSIADTCGTTTYTWDARNRLTAINGFTAGCSPLSADFRYDALGRRIEKTINGKTIRYLYDGLDIVQEIKNGIASASYIRMLEIDEPLARIGTDGVRFYKQRGKEGRFPIYWGSKPGSVV